MVSIIIYILLLLIIVFAAAPFSLVEQVLNLGLDGFEYIANLLLAGLSWVANLLGAGLYGILSAAQSWLSGGLETVGIYLPQYSMLWTNVVWEVTFSPISFSSMGINTAFSPIGSVLSTWITDAATANLIGGLGIAAIAVLTLITIMKVR